MALAIPDPEFKFSISVGMLKAALKPLREMKLGLFSLLISKSEIVFISIPEKSPFLPPPRGGVLAIRVYRSAVSDLELDSLHPLCYQVNLHDLCALLYEWSRCDEVKVYGVASRPNLMFAINPDGGNILYVQAVEAYYRGEYNPVEFEREFQVLVEMPADVFTRLMAALAPAAARVLDVSALVTKSQVTFSVDDEQKMVLSSELKECIIFGDNLNEDPLIFRFCLELSEAILSATSFSTSVALHGQRNGSHAMVQCNIRSFGKLCFYVN